MVNRRLFKVAELNHTAEGGGGGEADMQILTSSPPCNNCRSTPVLVTRHLESIQGIRRELVDEQLSRHKSNLLHVTRINNNSKTKIILNYRPNGRRRLGRPLKRLDDAETGLSKPNWWRVMMGRMGLVFGWRGYMLRMICKCPSSQCILDWYFWLTYRAIKQFASL
jgi:hypothetical protein